MDSSAKPANFDIKKEMEGNLRGVQERIGLAAQRSGRNPQAVTIVAVTKTVEAPRIKLACELGLRHFGENRVQEAESKIRALDLPVTWHMVGHLQTNKARDAVELFDVIHSVDSVRIAEAIDRQCSARGKQMPALLEINIAGEDSKYGFAPKEVMGEVEAILRLPSITVQGLMTVAPMVATPEEARAYFHHLRELRDRLAVSYPEITWHHLSMGMTDDFEVAVEEGATLVRIGRAIFGERPH